MPEDVAVRTALQLDAAEKRRSEEQPMKLGVGPATHASVTPLRVVFQTAAVAGSAGHEPKPDFPPCGIGRPPLR